MKRDAQAASCLRHPNSRFVAERVRFRATLLKAKYAATLWVPGLHSIMMVVFITGFLSLHRNVLALIMVKACSGPSEALRAKCGIH
jgi:hypothetical protein